MKVAHYEGDEVKCECGRTIAVGVGPISAGARVPCKGCGEWVELPLRTAVAPSSTRYPTGGI